MAHEFDIPDDDGSAFDCALKEMQRLEAELEVLKANAISDMATMNCRKSKIERLEAEIEKLSIKHKDSEEYYHDQIRGLESKKTQLISDMIRFQSEEAKTIGDNADLARQIADAREEIARLRKAAFAYRDLCACYRVGKRPSEELFERIMLGNQALEASE